MMAQELLYTSAPRGLKPGSRGFCTVLSTQGMPAPLASALESLSGYRAIYPPNDERAARNPVVYSHLKMQATGRSWHVLSRIADYGLDYSQRPNKLAHHVILDNPTEQLPGGPANLLSMSGFMRESWEGDPKLVAPKPITREQRPHTGICERWKEVTGDAGWAGVVAESFLRDPDRQVILLFEPGQEILPLFAEAISLLPPEKRWDVTFSTYFTGLATGTTCNWRAIVAGSKEATESLRNVTAFRLNLCRAINDSQPPDAELVRIARSSNLTAIDTPATKHSIGIADHNSASTAADSPASLGESDLHQSASVPSSPPTRFNRKNSTNGMPPSVPNGRRDARNGRSTQNRSRRWHSTVMILSSFLFIMTATAICWFYRPLSKSHDLDHKDIVTQHDDTPETTDLSTEEQDTDATSQTADAAATRNTPPTQSNSSDVARVVNTEAVLENRDSAIELLPQPDKPPSEIVEYKEIANDSRKAAIFEFQFKSGTFLPLDDLYQEMKNWSTRRVAFESIYGMAPPTVTLLQPEWLGWKLRNVFSDLKKETLEIVDQQERASGARAVFFLSSRTPGTYSYNLRISNDSDTFELIKWCALQIDFKGHKSELPYRVVFWPRASTPKEGNMLDGKTIKLESSLPACDKMRTPNRISELCLSCGTRKWFVDAPEWVPASTGSPIHCEINLDRIIRKTIELPESYFESNDPVTLSVSLASSDQSPTVGCSVRLNGLFRERGLLTRIDDQLNRELNESLSALDLTDVPEHNIDINSLKLFFSDEAAGTKTLLNLRTRVDELVTNILPKLRAANNADSERIKRLDGAEMRLKNLIATLTRLQQHHLRMREANRVLETIRLSSLKITYDLFLITNTERERRCEAPLINFVEMN